MQLGHGKATIVGLAGRNDQLKLGVEVAGCRLLHCLVSTLGLPVGLFQQDLVPRHVRLVRKMCDEHDLKRIGQRDQLARLDGPLPALDLTRGRGLGAYGQAHDRDSAVRGMRYPLDPHRARRPRAGRVIHPLTGPL